MELVTINRKYEIAEAITWLDARDMIESIKIAWSMKDFITINSIKDNEITSIIRTKDIIEVRAIWKD